MTVDCDAAGRTDATCQAGEIPTPAHRPALGPQLRGGLRTTLEHEREHLQKLFDSAQSQLAAREARLASRVEDLEERERQVAEAEARAATIEADARRQADALIAETRERGHALGREMLAAEQHLAETQQATDEHIQTMLAEAERQSEQIRSGARSSAQVAGNRVFELLRLREELLTSVRETLSDFHETVASIEREEPPRLPGEDGHRSVVPTEAPHGAEAADPLAQSTSGSAPREPA